MKIKNNEITDDDIERFLRKIEIKDLTQCWNYKEYKLRGYGQFNLKTKIKVRAPRFVYCIYYGSFDETLQVCHTCDNPTCCNPFHLWLGTSKENSDDKYRKQRNRSAKGIENNSKLTNENIIEILYLLNLGIVQYDIAKKFNVNQSVISRIKNNKVWIHIRR